MKALTLFDLENNRKEHILHKLILNKKMIVKEKI